MRTSAEQAPFRFVDVAVPVRGLGGELQGILGAHLSWNWASEVRDDVLEKHAAKGETEIWIVGRDGQILLGPSSAKPLGPLAIAGAAKRGGVTFRDDTDAKPKLVALASTNGQGEYPGLGWIVSARRSVETALGPANWLTLVIGIIGFFAALVGTVLAWLLATGVTKPLSKLCYSLDRVGRDSETAIIERQHGSRDVLRLSAALRSLMRRLGTAERSAREIRGAADNIKRAAEKRARDAEERTRRLGSDIHTLRVLADTDPLTGLFNRRAFLPFAEDAMNYFKRYRRGVAVLMFDIDHFKRVNDTFGHACGDQVIRAVGQIIADQIRATDKVARFGGEEFVVLLRETDREGAILLANRVREKVAAKVMGEHTAPFSVTISVGIALAQMRDRDIEDVIARADAALYAAKSGGRNRAIADLTETSSHIAA